MAVDWEEVYRSTFSDLVRYLHRKVWDADREALLLWDAGLSYREIADRMGLAPGAVGTTLARARKRLVEAYGERKEEEDAARG